MKPIRVQVFEASDETLARVKEIERQNTGFKGQRTPDEFKVNKIKADRELRRNPNYVPEFVNYPITNKLYSGSAQHRRVGEDEPTRGSGTRQGRSRSHTHWRNTLVYEK